ncbi:DUF1028 domain-containing protein [Porticoccaceae bacterium nBUS_09]
MTFSIAAHCPKTGMFGVTVTSSSICVASRCAFARRKVGAALSQNVTDPNLGGRLLDLCENGATAEEALVKVIAETPNIQWRQLGIVDSNGYNACYSGEHTLGINAMAQGDNCTAIGNLLANEDIPGAIVNAFENTGGHLAERLLMALQAGLDAGGEAGPIHSAGIKVYADQEWPVVDLRVDWDPTPDNAISRLRDIWEEYQPQMQPYITRAANPAESESYGVPGDE